MADNILPLIPDLQTQIDDIQTSTTSSNTQSLGRVYKFDFDNKRFVMQDGKLIELDTNKEKIEQWIHLILLTYKDKFEVYKNTDFYCNIADFFGKKIAGYSGYYQSELQNEIKTALLKNNYIQSVDSFTLTHMEGTKWQVNYRVTLIDGVIDKEEVL